MAYGLPRWKVVENAVAAIQAAHGQSGQWTVTPNAMVRERVSGKRRQVDAFLECPSGPTVFRVAIDVKDKGQPLDIQIVEQLCAKGEKLDVDRYVIVSTSGFAGPARSEAERQGVELATVELASETAFFQLAHLTSRRIVLTKIDLAFDEGVEEPPLATAGRSWIEDVSSCTRIDRFAEIQAMEHDAKGGAQPGEGQVLFLCVQDPNMAWKKTVIDGVAWPPPRELHIWWTTEEEDAAGLLLRTDDGREVFTAILKVDGDDRQITLVQNTANPAGSTITVDMRPARPPRKNV